MLFLVHHADAVDVTVDPQRPLSSAGRSHAERLAATARDRGAAPAAIWHSGKLRARQTAEPFLRLCNPMAEFAAVRDLQPEDPPEWIQHVVEAEVRDIMLVGHMPHIARLLALLTARSGGTGAYPAHGLVALERRNDGWVEAWRSAGE